MNLTSICLDPKSEKLRLVPSNMFKPSSNSFAERSKWVLLLWIICFICLLRLSVLLTCLFLAVLWSPAGKGLTSRFSCTAVCDVFLCSNTFPYGVMGQVWYLIASVPDICPLTYFNQPNRF